MDKVEFRNFIEELIAVSRGKCPTSGALTRAVELVYGITPYRNDYCNSRVFPVSTELKLYSEYTRIFIPTLGSSVLTCVGHGFTTDTEAIVYIDTGVLADPLVDSKLYYITVLSDDTFSLSINIGDPAEVITDVGKEEQYIRVSINTRRLKVTAGTFQLERIWYRAVESYFTLSPSSTYYVYADGDVTSDDVTAEIKVSTDSSLSASIETESLTGTFEFVKGSTTVRGVGTAFLTELDDIDRIKPTSNLRYSYVSYINSDEELVLVSPYLDEDYNGSSVKGNDIYLFGSVITDTTSITDIVSPGRLNNTAVCLSAESKGHGYELVIPSNMTLLDEDSQDKLLLRLLKRWRPMHKLGYVLSEGDKPEGWLMGEGSELYTQSDIDYEENFESSLWPVVT
jgi:hypothetical protein